MIGSREPGCHSEQPGQAEGMVSRNLMKLNEGKQSVALMDVSPAALQAGEQLCREGPGSLLGRTWSRASSGLWHQTWAAASQTPL